MSITQSNEVELENCLLPDQNNTVSCANRHPLAEPVGLNEMQFPIFLQISGEDTWANYALFVYVETRRAGHVCRGGTKDRSLLTAPLCLAALKTSDLSTFFNVSSLIWARTATASHV